MPKLLINNFTGGKAGSQFVGPANSYYNAQGLTADLELGRLIPGWNLNNISDSGSNTELDLIVSFAIDSLNQVAYGVSSGGKLHKITGLPVAPVLVADATWAQTIGAGTDNHDAHSTFVGSHAIIWYEKAASLNRFLYSYNDTTDGDVGQCVLSSGALNDDWFSTLTGGAVLDKSFIHPLFVWKNDGRCYIGDGATIRYVYDDAGTTKASSNATVIPPGWEITSFFDAGNYLGICAWYKGSTTVPNQCAVFLWDGVSSQAIDSKTIDDGKIYASIVRKNIPYIFTGDKFNGLRTFDGQDILRFQDDADTVYGAPADQNAVDTYSKGIVWMLKLGSAIQINTYGALPRLSDKWEMPCASIAATALGAIKLSGFGSSQDYILISYTDGSSVHQLKYFKTGQQHTSGAILRTLYYSFPQRIRINYIRVNLLDDLTTNEDFDLNMKWYDIDITGETELGDFKFSTDGAKCSKTFRLTPHNSYCHSFRLLLDWNTNTVAPLGSIVVDYDYVPDLR